MTRQSKTYRPPLGSNNDDLIVGSDSDDIIIARGGDDTIRAGDGNDLINAGRGDDVIYTGGGSDLVLGGSGFDRVVLDGGFDDYRVFSLGRFTTFVQEVDDEGRTVALDTLNRVEAITFSEDDYTLYLDGRNNSALARDDSAATGEDDTLVLSSAQLLANDVDPDGDTLTLTAVDAVSALGATVSLENGQVIYVPGDGLDALGEGEVATDSFAYEVSDGQGGVSSTTVTVTVTGTNDAPVLSLPTTIAVAENIAGSFVMAEASDVDSEALTFSIEGGDDAALFTIDAETGALSFAFAPDFEAPADQDGDNVYDVIVAAMDDLGATDTAALTVTVTDEAESTARVNELHYDNVGGDIGEFVEIRLTAGESAEGLLLELLNGNGGTVYNALTAADARMTTDGAYDYYVFELPPNGLQNGSPDGLALSTNEQLIEFLSYEGSFTAQDGVAAGTASTDIGVFEAGDTPIGFSLQRNEDGSWGAPREETPGLDNDFRPALDPRINEFHYDNEGTDQGEFVEVRTNAGVDASALTVELVNGSNGTVYDTLAVTEAETSTDGTYDYYIWQLPTNGLQNGSPDGIALGEEGRLVEFLSYEGTFEAADGVAAGTVSTDIGVSENSGTGLGLALQREEDGTWTGPREETPGASNTAVAATTARINEFHYDNEGGDVGEAIEVRVAAGEDVSSLTIELVNGNGGAIYNSTSVSSLTMTTDGAFDYYVWSLPSNGIQNGAPDGIVLAQDGRAVEFLSYEGEFTAATGAAAGLTSTDIGVAEGSDTPEGVSLQREEDGSWAGPRDETFGADNDGVPPAPPRINEVHYDNEGSDVGEFVEVRVAAGTDVSGLTVELLNGNGGGVYESTAVADLDMTTDGDFDYYVWSGQSRGIQNGGPDGIVLAQDGTAIEFLSYEGTFTATGGAANGQTSVDIGVEERGDTPVGFSLQRNADGSWDAPRADTAGAANDDGGTTPPEPGELVLISAIQGNGLESGLQGQSVSVSAVVTRVIDGGFYLQEEVDDYDGDAMTSEGIFVSYDDGSFAAGDLLTVSGIVEEQFGQTALSSVRGIEYIATGITLPDYADITLPRASASALEQYEGMRVSLISATDAPITVIENFNLDRFGEIVVSAGTQVQPTQIYDAQTQAAEIDALQEANALNRLVIDDGDSGQNPNEFRYIPSTGPNDNGNGYLDAGDDFGDGGPTLRLGAEMTGAVEGVLGFGFGEYRLLPDELLPIDESTNTGARQETPGDVGGSLQVVSLNALNYFTSLSDGTATNPAGQARGARSTEDLARQADKLVDAIIGSGGEAFGLQEVENNGFGDGSAVSTLVDALNAAVGQDRFAFVTPDGIGGDGFVGTDAITNAIIYDQTALSLEGSAVLIFNDGGQQRNRPAVAASFTEIETGETFNLVVNHLKSKGGTGSGADADQDDGQGAFNATRTDATNELADWIRTDPTGSGDADYIVLGDFNAYAQEDPVQAMRGAGYTDLIDTFIGQDEAYSYTFDGQRGTLDQGFATASAADQVTGVTEWHINADEPDLLGYSSQFTDAGFYGDTPYSASDHDPLVIGLDLSSTGMV